MVVDLAGSEGRDPLFGMSHGDRGTPDIALGVAGLDGQLSQPHGWEVEQRQFVERRLDLFRSGLRVTLVAILPRPRPLPDSLTQTHRVRRRCGGNRLEQCLIRRLRPSDRGLGLGMLTLHLSQGQMGQADELARVVRSRLIEFRDRRAPGPLGQDMLLFELGCEGCRLIPLPDGVIGTTVRRTEPHGPDQRHESPGPTGFPACPDKSSGSVGFSPRESVTFRETWAKAHATTTFVGRVFPARPQRQAGRLNFDLSQCARYAHGTISRRSDSSFASPACAGRRPGKAV